MTTLIDIRKEVTVCNETAVRKIYTIIALRLRGIYYEIKRHEHYFSNYPIKDHPLTTYTTLIINEIDALHKLPEDCVVIKKHAHELALRLREFKAVIGTPFCKTAHQAYDWFGNNIVHVFWNAIKYDLAQLPDIPLQFIKLYEEILKDAVRTQQPQPQKLGRAA